MEQELSVPAAQEAGATPLPLILVGRSTLGAPQPHQDPLQLFAFPATGDSTVAELPGGNSNLDFGIEINIQQGICFPAVPWGVSFFYSFLLLVLVLLGRHFSLVPLGLFPEPSILGVTQQCVVCVP